MKDLKRHITEIPLNEPQRLYVWLCLGLLSDVVVLSVASDAWVWVTIPYFFNILRLAVLVEVLLTAAFYVRRKILKKAAHLQTGFTRGLSSFGSLLVILAAKGVIFVVVTYLLPGHVSFDGPLNGAVALLITIFLILFAEAVLKWGFYALSDDPDASVDSE